MMTLPTDLPAPLAAALTARGYETLTEVQTSATRADLAGRDLLVSARTGSGKTVAFGLVIAPDLLGEAERFGPAGKPMALAIAPTRELAQQVARELAWLYAPTGATIATCVGGMDMRDERRALDRGAHIVVGTPGRLSDHINRRSLDTSEIRVVVLDEADEMLDLGFREELEHILQDTPEERRTLMFSATVPRGIAALAERYQKNALRITTANEAAAHADIAYEALMVAPGDEENAIVNIVRQSDTESALVFCSTRAAVNHLVARLGNRGFSVVALSGEFSQKERANALGALRSGRARVCIATDVAARGLDLPKLDLVIHADLPRDPATLLHRSGRTGRAGRKGISTLIVSPKSRRKVERLLHDAKLTARWGRPPSADEVSARDDARLLADPALNEAPTEAEENLIARLLAERSPEAIAAAFIRKAREGRSAPEDLREVDDRPPRKPREERSERGEREWQDRPPREKAPRGDREPRSPRGQREGLPGAVWIALNVGRKKNADPKWLLPMLCKAGGISRDQIGQIRVNTGNTHVELTPEGAEKLFETTGNGRLEGSLQAFPLEGIPAPEDSAPHSQGDRRPPRPAYDKPAGKPEGKAHKSYGKAPGKPAAKPSGKAYGKPPGGAGKPPRKGPGAGGAGPKKAWRD